MENKFVDTNVFLRYFTKDDPSKYERCRAMFKKALEGEIAISTSGRVGLWGQSYIIHFPFGHRDVIEN